ncbi:MAG: HEAT repeat domain-containing protein [Anaerolineae bacterium]|nr:HEAT repeat domain-containing protein [Anaerolineae bacterium]
MPKTETLREVEEKVHELALKPRNVGQIPELVDLLAAMAQVEDDPESAYEELEWIVREIGQAAVPVLLQTLQTKEPAKRAAVLYLLMIVGEPGNTEIIEAAKVALHDKHDLVRDTAVGTLAAAADENAIPVLIELIETLETTSFYHVYAVAALGRLSSPKAIQALTKRLYAENRTGSTNYVIEALEQIGTPDAIAAIHDWKQSEFGKAHINQQAEFLLQSFDVAPASSWQEAIFYTIIDTPDNEVLRLDQDIRFLAFAKGIRAPELSDRIAHVLERSNNPRARKVLEQWRNEQ